MNRCISITKNNTRCRAKTKNNLLFCCDEHKPINKEIIENGCFMCMEKIEKSNEILFLKCKHAFHKPCYVEWLKFSTYDSPICIICRNIAFNPPLKKIKRPLKFVSNTVPIDDILNTLEIKKKVYTHNKIFKPSSPDYPPPPLEIPIYIPSSPDYPPPSSPIFPPSGY
jgi:hypothetical protein